MSNKVRLAALRLGAVGTMVGSFLAAKATFAAPTVTFSATEAGSIIDTIYDGTVPFVTTYLPIILLLGALVGLVMWFFRKLKGGLRGR